MAVYAGQYYNDMWMGNDRSSIQNGQNGNDNLLIRAIRHSHSVRNQCICLFPVDLLSLFQQFIPQFGKEWQHRPATGFTGNGSLYVHICERAIPVCIHALYSFNHCFYTLAILGFTQNQTKKAKRQRQITEETLVETIAIIRKEQVRRTFF